MWNASFGGRRLTFHLSGINNQNFLMRDEETGTWWQQSDGEAVLGPLRGAHLAPVFADEVSFAIWRREHPRGRVLAPAADPAWRRFSANWEAGTATLPVVTAAVGPLPPRTVVVGIQAGGEERAYPLDVLLRQSPVMDDLGGTGVAILVGDDAHSVRAFDSTLAAPDGRRLSFFAAPGAGPGVGGGGGAGNAGAPWQRRWLDSATGSEWNFQGLATAGPLQGKRLRPVPVLQDYWFDWRIYHPRTSVYTGGRR